MNLFDVYSLFPIEPVRARGCRVWDRDGREYLDFYGGHAVISIGHGHPHYRRAIKEQIDRIGFYSNSVQNPLQQTLAEKLGQLSGYEDYQLFLCNSGAEANENALKLASFHTGRSRIVAFRGAFHGRTSAAVAMTDNPNIQAPVNRGHEVTFLPLNDAGAAEAALADGDVCAVIIEGIQGVAGIIEPEADFLRRLRELCDRSGTLLILDEVQSGYGRTGDFFAHQRASVRPDLITVAKGMGNGFPIAGVLIHPAIKPKTGMLGTTFGGNHLAAAAGLAVLEVIERENLMKNAAEMGERLQSELTGLHPAIREVRGRGLMLGVTFDQPVADLRKRLLHDFAVFTGAAADKHVLRLLPPLCVSPKDIDPFLEAFNRLLRRL